MTLISRLEAAMAGSRELDAEIALAIGYTRAWHEDIAPNRGGWYWRFGDLGSTHESHDWPPLFSTSIDAALTLVPDAHEWTVGVDLENRVATASVGEDVWDEAFNLAIGRARTPALALVIASLKARMDRDGQ